MPKYVVITVSYSVYAISVKVLLSPKVIWEKFAWVTFWLLTINVVWRHYEQFCLTYKNNSNDMNLSERRKVLHWWYSILNYRQYNGILVGFFCLFFCLSVCLVITSYSLLAVFIIPVNGDSCKIRFIFLDCLLSSSSPCLKQFYVTGRGLQEKAEPHKLYKYR